MTPLSLALISPPFDRYRLLTLKTFWGGGMQHRHPAVGEASSLTPSLAEVANHCYTQQGTPFSTATPSPTAATNQFRLPHSAFHTGATLDTTVAVDLLMTRNAAASTGLGVHNHHNHTMPRSTSTRKGGRRPREIEERNQKNLTDEDKDKRAKRRQRNKEAAARCRKRRLDQMVELQKEVEALKMEGQQYLKMVEQLQRERDQIAQQLSQHANCKIPNAMVHQQRQFSQNSIVPPFKNESLMHSGLNNSLHATFFKEEDELMSESSPPSSQYTNSTCNMAIMDTDNDPVISDAAMKKPKQEDMIDPPFVTRPNSLSFKNPSYDVGNLTNTPSHGLITPSMFEFNLLNQPTGLTPVANGPMPVTSTTMAPRDRGELRQL
ncbi:bZIP transcription factor domain-containing protein [Ditylenchus destructor]|nr:bZIP transcription factor domain-containing protein [Ditylenchus destructor]